MIHLCWLMYHYLWLGLNARQFRWNHLGIRLKQLGNYFLGRWPSQLGNDWGRWLSQRDDLPERRQLLQWFSHKFQIERRFNWCFCFINEIDKFNILQGCRLQKIPRRLKRRNTIDVIQFTVFDLMFRLFRLLCQL